MDFLQIYTISGVTLLSSFDIVTLHIFNLLQKRSDSQCMVYPLSI